MSEEDRLKLVESAKRLEPLATGELLGFGLDVADLIDSVTRLVYAVVMAVSWALPSAQKVWLTPSEQPPPPYSGARTSFCWVRSK